MGDTQLCVMVAREDSGRLLKVAIHPKLRYNLKIQQFTMQMYYVTCISIECVFKLYPRATTPHAENHTSMSRCIQKRPTNEHYLQIYLLSLVLSLVFSFKF